MLLDVKKIPEVITSSVDCVEGWTHASEATTRPTISISNKWKSEPICCKSKQIFHSGV